MKPSKNVVAERVHESDGDVSGEAPIDLETIAASPSSPMAANFVCVARCINVRHPTLTGRVLCEVTAERGSQAMWVPTLQGLTIRVDDQVLLSKPTNWDEPVVVGVLDGFARRPETLQPAAQLVLERDEAVVVETRDGERLIEVRQGADGPVVTVLQDDIHVEMRGALKVSAKSIALVAREGEARIDATSDVIVRGETIQLN